MSWKNDLFFSTTLLLAGGYAEPTTLKSKSIFGLKANLVSGCPSKACDMVSSGGWAYP